MTVVAESAAPEFTPPVLTKALLNEAYLINQDFDAITAAQKGNTEAFGELYARYNEPLNRYLGRLCGGDYARAEDITQEAFIKALGKISQLTDKKRGAGPWLHTIARRTFLDDARRVQRQKTDPVEDMSHLAPRRRYDMPVDDGINARIDIMRSLAGMSADRRTTVALVHYFGISNTEVAEFLGISRMTVGSRLSRAKPELIRQLVGYANAS